MTPVRFSDIAEKARCGVSDYRDKLGEHGFAILEPEYGHPAHLDEIMSALGTPVEYQFGAKLAIEPRADATNSQFSNRGMPLHTDAVLNAGNDVTYIGMECVVAPETGGETTVASSAAFFELAPPDLIDTLRAVTIEYRSRVGGYYKESADGGFPTKPPIRANPATGEDTLYLALDDPDDEFRNYSAHVVGYTAEDSTRLLNEIDALLHRPEAFYAHVWRPGEILLLDNRRVLHGRAPFPAGSPRKLVRLSVA